MMKRAGGYGSSADARGDEPETRIAGRRIPPPRLPMRTWIRPPMWMKPDFKTQYDMHSSAGKEKATSSLADLVENVVGEISDDNEFEVIGQKGIRGWRATISCCQKKFKRNGQRDVMRYWVALTLGEWLPACVTMG